MEEPITKQTAQTEPIPSAEVTSEQKPEVSPVTDLTVKKKPSLKTVLIIAAACAVVITAAVVFFARNSPESVAKRFAIAYCTDEKTATSLYAYDGEAYLLVNYDGDAEDFFEKQSEIYDADISSWSEYYNVLDADQKEYLEDWYGEYEVTAEVTRSKDVSVKNTLENLESHIKYLETRVSFDSDAITDAKQISVKIKIAGEEYIDREKMTIYMVKTSGKWGVLEWEFTD